VTVHSVRPRRSLAEDAHRSPVISQRSYVQPSIPIASTTRSPASKTASIDANIRASQSKTSAPDSVL
jgi:hypothetical protein